MPTKVVLVLFMFQVLIHEIKNSKSFHFIERPVTDNKKLKKMSIMTKCFIPTWEGK